MRSKPPCTCSHVVTPQHGHNHDCPRGLTMWNNHNRRAANRLGRENEILRHHVNELRAEIRELRAELRNLQ